MSLKPPFNPIEIPNIALNLALEVLEQPICDVPPSPGAVGAGVYLLYYTGPLEQYRPISEANKQGLFKSPIYVGKADRKGKRKGFTFQPGYGGEIQSRLRNHAESIKLAQDLCIKEFSCRFLSIEDAFIGLAESVLVSIYEPLWNKVLDGFGNNPTGGPRSTQATSKWDVFHPGRTRGVGLARFAKADLDGTVASFLARPPSEAEERLKTIRTRIERYGLA